MNIASTKFLSIDLDENAYRITLSETATVNAETIAVVAKIAACNYLQAKGLIGSPSTIFEGRSEGAHVTMRPLVSSWEQRKASYIFRTKGSRRKVVTPRFSMRSDWVNPAGADIAKICAKDYPFERRFLWKQLGVLAFGAVFWLL